MKKIITVFLAVVISFSLCSVGFASGLVTDKPGSGSGSSLDISSAAILNFFKSVLDSIGQSLARRTEASRYYYFSVIINDKYNSSCSVFDSSVSYKFSDEILKFYFEQYTYAEIIEDKFDSEGDVYLAAAGFSSPFSLSLLNFYTKSLSGSVDSTHSKEFDKFKSYYNTLLARYVLDQGGEAEDPNPGQSGMDIAPGYVTSEEFNEYIEYANNLNTPKGRDLFKQSYQTNTFFYSDSYRPNEQYRGSEFPLFDDTNSSAFENLYLVPFYVDNSGVSYYPNYQFHLYYVPNDDPNSDLALKLDIYQWSSDFGYTLLSNDNPFVFELLSSMKPYVISFFPFPEEKAFGYWSTQSDYVSGARLSYSCELSSMPYIDSFYSSDGTLKHLYYPGDADPFTGIHSLKSSAKLPADIGFICSKSLMEREYKDIDLSKIPSNQVINISGDTIYDYSITNPETGQTSTINNYITNNYNYPALPTTSGGGSGGVGGNVNVSGDIGVHGDVGVDITVSVPDININVNQGSGAGENGGDNVGDYIDTSGDVDVGGIISKLPQLSKGFTDYLKGFFTWLPPEIYALVVALMFIYVWKAIISRR